MASAVCCLKQRHPSTHICLCLYPAQHWSFQHHMPALAGIVLLKKQSLIWESHWHGYTASHFRSSVQHRQALIFQSVNQIWIMVLVASKHFFFFFNLFSFSPAWNENAFVVLEIFLQDWKDFSCACCLWSCISQCNYNIALMLSWSLFSGAAKHNSVRVALFWAGSKFWALLSALKLSNVWKAGGWWDLVGTFGRCGVWKAVFT